MQRFIKYLEKKQAKKNTRSIQKIKDSTKYAILIGLNYPGSHYALKGCVNDVKNGAKYLKSKSYDVKTLFDSQITKQYNVLEALTELKNSKSSTVFFHYSGHGTQIRDQDGDELDGKDEVVYSNHGVQILDDDINKLLASFPKEKTVFLVFDCCHSGSIVDLPYILNYSGYQTEKVTKSIAANVICISGCRDSQTSADICERGTAFGALSSTLYSLLTKYRLRNVTWRQLYSELLNEMKKKNYRQIPMLSVSNISLFNSKVDL